MRNRNRQEVALLGSPDAGVDDGEIPVASVAAANDLDMRLRPVGPDRTRSSSAFGGPDLLRRVASWRGIGCVRGETRCPSA